MSHDTATLLIRNLDDIFGESDPGRRRTAIDALLTEDCVFYAPDGPHRGRDDIHRTAGAIRQMQPDFQYQPIASPEVLGDSGRIRWVAGRPNAPPDYAGTDFIIVRDGQIAAIYLFFDPLP